MVPVLIRHTASAGNAWSNCFATATPAYTSQNRNIPYAEVMGPANGNDVEIDVADVVMIPRKYIAHPSGTFPETVRTNGIDSNTIFEDPIEGSWIPTVSCRKPNGVTSTSTMSDGEIIDGVVIHDLEVAGLDSLAFDHYDTWDPATKSELPFTSPDPANEAIKFPGWHDHALDPKTQAALELLDPRFIGVPYMPVDWSHGTSAGSGSLHPNKSEGLSRTAAYDYFGEQAFNPLEFWILLEFHPDKVWVGGTDSKNGGVFKVPYFGALNFSSGMYPDTDPTRTTPWTAMDGLMAGNHPTSYSWGRMRPNRTVRKDGYFVSYLCSERSIDANIGSTVKWKVYAHNDPVSIASTAMGVDQLCMLYGLMQPVSGLPSNQLAVEATASMTVMAMDSTYLSRGGIVTNVEKFDQIFFSPGDRTLMRFNHNGLYAVRLTYPLPYSGNEVRKFDNVDWETERYQCRSNDSAFMRLEIIDGALAVQNPKIGTQRMRFLVTSAFQATDVLPRTIELIGSVSYSDGSVPWPRVNVTTS
jgi:hypothetical protein